MSFWSNPTLAVPKRSHRFLLLLDLDGKDKRFLVQSVDKPSFTTHVDEATGRDGKVSYWATGHFKWEPITVTFIVDAEQDFDKVISNLKSGELRAKKFPAMTIQELDGSGNKLGKWKLDDCVLENIKYSTLDYTTEDLQTVTMTIKYSTADYSPDIGGQAASRVHRSRALNNR